MIGYSYYGKIQLKVAIEQPPHLKAVFVSHVGADMYRDFAYSGGVLSLFFYGLWDGRHGTSGFAPKNATSQMMKNLPPEEFERRRRSFSITPISSTGPIYFICCTTRIKIPTFLIC